MAKNLTFDNVVVGGGIIGLSIAYELAKRGRQVVLLEREGFGQKSSWAGAGIIVPTNAATAIHAQEHLEALSHQLHGQWSEELKQQTGIDNGFRKCGGLYLARTAGEVAALGGMMLEWQAREIDHAIVELDKLTSRYPCVSKVSGGASQIRKAIWVPGESQFSNPHHNDALVAACRKMKVALIDNSGAATIQCHGKKIECVFAGGEKYAGENYFFASGPWTEQLIEPTGVSLPMQPVRGQIALYQVPPEKTSTDCWPIVNEGSRYLVPRSDGHVLAGATIEEVGFDCRTTDDEIRDLRSWAESWNDWLNESTYVKSWAGLRPGTYDGFPYLGRLGEFKNAFVATGHFKCGLHLSTGTAVLMADLAEGISARFDLQPFNPSRAADHQSIEIK